MITITCINNINQYITSFDEITDPNNVVGIDCSKNNLTILPNNMIWPQLQKFDCSNNNLTQLPSDLIINMPNLIIFSCSSNQLTQLPIINPEKTTNLRYFFCSNNYLTKIPCSIFDLPKLCVFYCYTNQLLDLSSSTLNLPCLVELNCNDNQILDLPNIIAPKLLVLNCGDNQLEQLPDTFICPSLQRLICYGNRINSVPFINNQLQIICRDDDSDLALRVDDTSLLSEIITTPNTPSEKEKNIFNCMLKKGIQVKNYPEPEPTEVINITALKILTN
jgi:Leucine-rich repeat (LRR) protein